MKYFLEKWHPIALSIATALICVVFRLQIQHLFAEHHLSMPQLYIALFGWASVQTGALIGVYGIVFTKSDGFIGEIKNSYHMKAFYQYTKTATTLGLVLTICSIPLIVKNAEMDALHRSGYAAVSLWFCLFVWAFLAFVRVAWLFSLMVKVPDRQFVPA